MAQNYLGLDHIGIAVPNLEEAVRTYRDVLGFTLSGEQSLPERGLRVAFFETGGTRLELIAPTRDNSEVSRFIKERRGGVHHLCVKVADIQKAVSELVARGAQVLGGAPGPVQVADAPHPGIKEGAHGTRVAFLHPKSCQGVLIELVETLNP